MDREEDAFEVMIVGRGREEGREGTNIINSY